MASNLRLRRIFKPLVTLLAKGLIKIRVSPNLATLIMFFFSILSFFALGYFQNLFFFSILVFITGLFDGIDGSIARLTNRKTPFGGFLDSVMDRFSEFIIFLALIIYNWSTVLWDILDMRLIIFIAFFASIMISYCRARAEDFFKGDFDIGLMARSERLFYIFLTMLLAFFYGYSSELLFIFMWLVIGTLIFRFKRIYHIIKMKNFQEIE
ncbi:hypothetical protein LCGC14_0404670 [marine sediment metagenome]|uniref:CDP-alcohol phosphatidyltransferase family protein n=1 Tax=marine sediment metagenome TaxID=412755 RepID=A0A0F9TDL6_9ZZZZ|nr:MAG: CDP-diacylglycerol--inositol 3-phosphatidyltransferase [Candidatus Lokiarchaeum sp. GC14_75]